MPVALVGASADPNNYYLLSDDSHLTVLFRMLPWGTNQTWEVTPPIRRALGGDPLRPLPRRWTRAAASLYLRGAAPGSGSAVAPSTSACMAFCSSPALLRAVAGDRSRSRLEYGLERDRGGVELPALQPPSASNPISTEWLGDPFRPGATAGCTVNPPPAGSESGRRSAAVASLCVGALPTRSSTAAS